MPLFCTHINIYHLFSGCHASTRLLGAGKLSKKDGAYFGPPKPESGLPRTQKGRSQSPERDGTGRFTYMDKTREPVPSKDDRPILGITTSKNFIVSNAVEAILQAPRRPVQKELNYLKKEDYGKVPAYLTQVKDEIRRENDMIERYVKEQMGEVERTPETFEELTEEERYTLLEELKNKWDHVNAKYQKQTHLVTLDTTGQVRRKEHMEAELNQLEHDIERLQRASTVLIKQN
jgi:gas vesicle protein